MNGAPINMIIAAIGRKGAGAYFACKERLARARARTTIELEREPRTEADARQR